MTRDGTRLVLPGEIGFDVGFNYPRGEVAREMGYTFGLGYISPNPKKNITPERSHEWYDAGLAQWLIWEVNAQRTNLGGAAGRDDGVAAAMMVLSRGYPNTVAVIAANDTDTTPANIAAQTAYMEAFHRACAPMGEYDDTDLAAATQHIPWRLGFLPNAYGWSAKQRDTAIAKAVSLGYHMIQGRMTAADSSYAMIDGITVDIDHCISPIIGWGQPTTETETDMDQFQILVTPPWPEGGYSVYMYDANGGTVRAVTPAEWDALGNPDAFPKVRVVSAADIAAMPVWKPLTVTATVVAPPMTVPDLHVHRVAPEEWLITDDT